MADKRMNQFQQVTDAEYVYVEDMNGSQGKIEWNNIIKKIITKSLENKNFLSENDSLDTIEMLLVMLMDIMITRVYGGLLYHSVLKVIKSN